MKLLRYARKVFRRDDEAEDVLQTVLMAAVEAGRADLSISRNRRWLIGALRKRALFDARTAARRRNREMSVNWAQEAPDDASPSNDRPVGPNWAY